MKIKKGDKVQILQGKDRGKTGKVDLVFAKAGKVLINGLNLVKKHTKPRGEGQTGGIIDKSVPMVVSKVALVCPKCDKKTRVGYKTVAGEKKRICLKCQSEI